VVIVMDLDLSQARRRAKELLRAALAGDPAALARMRDDRAPRLADAQRAVANELGFPSWPALVDVAEQATARSPESQLAEAVESWGERGETELDTGLMYTPGRPVRVRVRKRSHRYDIDDLGRGVSGTGSPSGWLAEAKRVVEAEGLNVNRSGFVFVPAVEGRDIYALVTKVAEASLAVHAALLDLDDG
jgi:hypothetical protein